MPQSSTAHISKTLEQMYYFWHSPTAFCVEYICNFIVIKVISQSGDIWRTSALKIQSQTSFCISRLLQEYRLNLRRVDRVVTTPQFIFGTAPWWLAGGLPISFVPKMKFEEKTRVHPKCKKTFRQLGLCTGRRWGKLTALPQRPPTLPVLGFRPWASWLTPVDFSQFTPCRNFKVRRGRSGNSPEKLQNEVYTWSVYGRAER